MAISASSYSVGNRVYNGGSSAPTRGTVDPMGYLDRELNKPSQSRSGIAASALRRMNNPYKSSTGQQGTNQQPMQPTKPQDSRVLYSGQATGLTGGGSPATTPPVGGEAMGGGRLARLGMSATGKLTAPTLAANGGMGLPFDAEANDAKALAMQANNRFESDYAASTQNLEKQYLQLQRDADLQMPDAERGLREGFAGRGLAYSSGYAHESGELQNEFARMKGDLAAGRTDGIADLLRQRGLWSEDYALMLNQIQQAAARRAAAEAAELELGVGLPGDTAASIQEPTDKRLSAPGSGGGTMPFRSSVGQKSPIRAVKPAAGSPGVAAPGAPPRGTAGRMVVNGQAVTVNAAGIIDSQGPYFGKYPAEVMGQTPAPAPAPTQVNVTAPRLGAFR